MKRRTRNLTAIIVLLAAGVLAIMLIRGSRAPGGKDFLDDLHEQRTQPPPDGITPSLPPVDGDQDLIPVIALETDSFDVGVVPNAKASLHRLKVHNSGRAPLKLTDVQTTCACTRGEIPKGKDIIPPGGESFVSVRVEPWRIPGFYSKKTLTIQSNDPMTPATTVAVIAHVDPEFEVLPEEILFGTIEKGAFPTETIVVRQVYDGPFEITEVKNHVPSLPEGSPGPLALALRERPEAQWATAGKREYEVDVALAPHVPPGDITYRGAFRLVTNIPRIREMSVKVTAQVSAPYRLSYKSNQILRMAHSEDDGDKISFSVEADAPIAITGIAPDIPEIEALLRPSESPNKAVIDLRGTTHDAPIEGGVAYTVVIDGVDYPEWVPVHGGSHAPPRPPLPAQAS